nr:MAG TPA: hypothetical protein [Caudoviricetes sp.]
MRLTTAKTTVSVENMGVPFCEIDSSHYNVSILNLYAV